MVSCPFGHSFNIMHMCHPIVPVPALSDPVRVIYYGSNDTIEHVPYIVCVDGQVLEMYELWYINAQGVYKVHPFA